MVTGLSANSFAVLPTSFERVEEASCIHINNGPMCSVAFQASLLHGLEICSIVSKHLLMGAHYMLYYFRLPQYNHLPSEKHNIINISNKSIFHV
jgi:hypothetical protein